MVRLVRNREQSLNSTSLGGKIEISSSNTVLKNLIPGGTWACKSFKFFPQSFSLNPKSFKPKLILKEQQINSLDRWHANPSIPTIYVCCSKPDDLKARYFAAYLVSLHLKTLGSKANVHWERLNSRYEDDGHIYDDSPSFIPSLLVLSELCIDSSKYRLEKARDLVNKYYNIPRIIVGGGTDPIDFAANYLRTPVNDIFYVESDLITKEIEIV